MDCYHWIRIRFPENSNSRNFKIIMDTVQRLNLSVIYQVVAKVFKGAKSATKWHSTPNYSTSTEPIPMTSSTPFSPVFLTSQYQSQFPIWASKQDEKRWKRWNFEVECWHSFLNHPYQVYAKQQLATNLMAVQRIALLTYYKNPGSHPSGISDLRQCSNFEVKKKGQK